MIDERLHIVGHLIRRAHQAHDAVFADHTAGFDVTSAQVADLCAISWNPCLDLSTLATVIGYDAATIGSLVNRLVAKRFVRRQVGKADRRTRELTLTARREAFLELVSAPAGRVEGALLAALSPEERRLFVDLLLRVVTSANAQESGICEEIA